MSVYINTFSFNPITGLEAQTHPLDLHTRRPTQPYMLRIGLWVYTAQTDGTIQMLNDVWTSLVNEVEATKKCYEELEATMTMTNDHLNDGISALDARVDKCKDKHHTLCNVMEGVWATINKQQCLM